MQIDIEPSLFYLIKRFILLFLKNISKNILNFSTVCVYFGSRVINRKKNAKNKS